MAGDQANLQKDIFGMSGLVQEQYAKRAPADLVTLLPWEYVIAIFWEETQFTNIRQQEFNHADWLKGPGSEKGKGNHAVGFGQVERESMILFKTQTSFTGAFDGLVFPTSRGPIEAAKGTPGWWHELDLAILASDALSVEMTWRALIHQMKRHPKATRAGLLQFYGGLMDEKGQPLPKMRRVARGWLATGSLFQAYRRTFPGGKAVGGIQGARKLLAAIFWCSRRNANFGGGFGVTPQESPRASPFGKTDIALLGDGLGVLAMGPAGPGGYPNAHPSLDKEYGEFVAEYGRRAALPGATDMSWVRPWVEDKYPAFKGQTTDLGPREGE